MRFREFVVEGGNTFKDPKTKQPLTTRINRADVDPTIRWVEKVTGIPLIDAKLGTTGKKATSGDLDLLVDDSKYSKDEVYKHLAQWAKSNGLKPLSSWVKKSGISVHLRTPIRGDEKNGYVQTDLMFGEPKMLMHTLQGSPEGSPYSGALRHVLMASIARAKGMRWSWQKGLIDRATNKIITRDPDEIAKRLLGPNATRKDIVSVESLLDNIKNDPNYDELVADARETFLKYGSEFPENP